LRAVAYSSFVFFFSAPTPSITPIQLFRCVQVFFGLPFGILFLPCSAQTVKVFFILSLPHPFPFFFFPFLSASSPFSISLFASVFRCDLRLPYPLDSCPALLDFRLVNDFVSSLVSPFLPSLLTFLLTSSYFLSSLQLIFPPDQESLPIWTSSAAVFSVATRCSPPLLTNNNYIFSLVPSPHFFFSPPFPAIHLPLRTPQCDIILAFLFVKHSRTCFILFPSSFSNLGSTALLNLLLFPSFPPPPFFSPRQKVFPPLLSDLRLFGKKFVEPQSLV